MDFKRLGILIFVVIILLTTLSPLVVYAYPFGNTKDLSTGSADSSWSGSGSFYYCFKINDETLTWQYFKDNPDFYITFTPSVDVKFFTEFGKDQVVEVSKGESFILNWDSLNSCFGEYIPADLNYYFYIGYSASAKGYMTMTCGGGSYFPEETEPTEPEPTDPEHGGSGSEIPDEDDSGLVDSILDGIKKFFSDLLSPIFDYLDSTMGLADAFADFFSVMGNLITDLIDNVNDAIDSVYQFVDDINTGVMTWILMIWETPIIKELMTYSVFILIVAALFKLLAN